MCSSSRAWGVIEVGNGKRGRRHVMARAPSMFPLSRVPFPAALLCVACATLGRLSFKEPDLELEQINLTGLGLTGGTLDLVFDVYNPNDYRIRSTRLDVGIDLEGTHFGDGSVEKPLDL